MQTVWEPKNATIDFLARNFLHVANKNTFWENLRGFKESFIQALFHKKKSKKKKNLETKEKIE